MIKRFWRLHLVEKKVFLRSLDVDHLVSIKSTQSCRFGAL